MYCEKCGAKNEADSLFCAKCGSRLSSLNDFEADSDFGDDKSAELDDTIIMKPVKSAVKNTESTPRVPASKRAVKIDDEPELKPQAKKQDGMKIAVAVLSCCLVLLLIVFGIFALKVTVSKDDDDVETLQSQTEGEKKPEDKKSEKTDEEKKEEEKEPEEEKPLENPNRNYSTIPVDMAYSSTERIDEDYTYSASYAVDSKLSTAWSPNAPGGVGESITLCFSTERTVHGVKISNGCSKSDEDYFSFSRLKDFTVKFPGGEAFSATLSDSTTALQDIRFKEAVDCRSLTIYVNSFYAGAEGSEPLCISEIEVY